MAKPVLFTIDDDPEVLRAVERDLRYRYAEHYRVLRAASGASALEALQQLKLRNEPVALLLADQRMPHMTGVEFLTEAMKLFPEAKRALLTAYADTDAAIAAINSVRIDHYLMKPWDPPEEHLYPIIDDLLDDWRASFRPPFEGIRVVGHRWSSESHRVKDFLARHHVPFQWLDIEGKSEDAEACRLLELASAEAVCLPLVLFPDGKQFMNPTNAELVDKVGLQTRAAQAFYDVIILGGGPAGMAAAVYGASEGLSTLMVDREAPGGQAGTSSRIENYLGFPAGLTGADLARRALAQARRFGVEVLSPQEAHGIRVQDQYRFITFGDGSEVSCHALIIATGVSYRKLEVPGAEKLTGAGVYYGAAMTEAMSCRDDDVFVVGGANSAGQAAIHLARYARSVVMLIRGNSLTKSMSQYLIDEIEQTPNITVRTNSHVVEVTGEEQLESVTFADTVTGERESAPARALFVFIGAAPHTECMQDLLERDEHGFLRTGPDLMHDGQAPKNWPLERLPFLLESNVPGIFVAGDVRRGSLKRCATAVGEGAMAVAFIHQYLSQVGA